MTHAIPHTASNSRPTFHSSLARPLIEEWARFRRDRRAVAAAQHWTFADLGELRDLDDLLTSVGALGDPRDSLADEMLAELVAVAHADMVAARVVLQRLLPGMVAIARRRGASHWGAQQEAFDDMVSMAWIVIRNFPIATRSRRVAANLLRDLEYKTFVRPRRLASGSEQARQPDSLPERITDASGRCPGERHAFDDIVSIISEARRSGLDGDDLRLAGRMAAGIPVSQMAKEFNVSERTLLKYRNRVTEMLRATVMEHAA
jgi:DNA-binding CsgD family transcriptional regulator